MTKPPEEGEIWEWRAFGQIGDRLAASVRALPVRMGISDHSDRDIYMISSISNHNVKLRKAGDEWLLKFKLLLASKHRFIELYSESASMLYSFPVRKEIIEQTAALLHTEFPDEVNLKESFERQEFIEAMARCMPPIVEVEVVKVRSQFQFERGWVEMADVVFSRHRAQSLSIHSPDAEAVEEMLDLLRPNAELEAMNYVDACRRWAGVGGQRSGVG